MNIKNSGTKNIDVSASQFLRDAIRKDVIKGKKYKVSTEVTGIKGEPYSAYFTVDNLHGRTVDRKMRWLNDFSGIKKIVQVIFTATSENLMIFYGINFRTPVHSDCKFQIRPIKEISIEEVSSNETDSFDDRANINILRPSEITAEQELKLEKNLVWIFASPRSGTTWLMGLLGHTTQTIDEPKIGTHLKISKSFDSHDTQKNIERDDFFFCDKFKDTWKFYLRKLILNRIYSQYRECNQKIVIKEPNGSYGAETISECLPNSKIIIIIRDGRDIVDSFVDGMSNGGWLTRRSGLALTSETRIPFIKEQCKRWNILIQILLSVSQKHSSNLLFLVRYEDLRNDTRKYIKKIYDFLEIKISSEELEEIVKKNSFENVPSDIKGKGKSIRSASPGTWKKNFSEDERSLLEKMLGENLKKLNY